MLKQLREKRAKLVAQMRDVIEAAEKGERDLTAEEQTTFDGLKAEKETLDKRIERLEGVEASEATLNATVPAASRRAGVALRAGGPEAGREFENIGEFLNAVRFRPNDQRLTFVEGVGAEGANDDLSAEFRMDNDRQGGFMVPTQLRTTILSIEPQAALVRPRAQIIPASSPPDAAITMPALNQSGTQPENAFGGMKFAWIEEGGFKPETGAELEGITLTPHEVAGHIKVTDKLLRNWQGSASFLEGLMRQGAAGLEDYAFIRGNGVGKPLGPLNAPVTKFVNRASANTVTYADLVAMEAVMLLRGGTPVWSMPQGALPKLRTMTDPEGHYIWSNEAAAGYDGTLLGYPVRWNNRMPLLGAKGDILLADWSYYLIKDGSGPYVAASEHVEFLNNKTVIKLFWNVDGAPWMKAPFKEENGYEVSPFVALDVPAA